MLDLPINNIGTLPGLELQIIQDKILLFLFCSIRISAFLISSPIFGAGYVLLPVRILFAMVLTLSIFQDQSALIDVQTITSSIGIILIAKEIAIGLSAGLVLTIWFSAASLAGEKNSKYLRPSFCSSSRSKYRIFNSSNKSNIDVVFISYFFSNRWSSHSYKNNVRFI